MSVEVKGTNPGLASVEFSRTQGVSSAIALGGSVVLGLSAFVAGGQLIRQSGSDAPLVFFTAALFFVPLILSCVQRSSGALSSGSFYAAARASGSSLRLFFTVWLMLGGYLAIGSLLVFGAATRLNVGLERIFGLKVGIDAVVLTIVAAVFVKELGARAENWRSRALIFWICTLFFATLVIWGFAAHFQSGVKAPKAEPLQHWLLAVSMLASCLWSIDIVLNYRGQFRNPNRTTIWSLLAIFCGGNFLVALISIEVLRNPSLFMQNWLSVLTWNQSRLEILILLAGVLICLSGALRVMSRITRLLGSMIIDGAIPDFDKDGETAGRSLKYYFVLFCAIVGYLAVYVSLTYLLLISGFGALLSLILYLYPLLKKDPARKVEFRLPLHPLIPALSIVLAIFLMWILPLQDLFIGFLWLFAGLILYVVGARKSMLPKMQQERVLASKETKPIAAGYRVLVCLDDEKINESIIRVGSLLAASRNGEVLVLRILKTSELAPLDFQRSQGQMEWNQIHECLQTLSLRNNPVAIIRMAPDMVSGIKATIREFKVDFIIVEWPEDSYERVRKSQLQNLLQISAKPLAILKGEFAGDPQTIEVACGNGAHSIVALQLADAIASVNNVPLGAIRIFTKSESEEIANDSIRKAIQDSGIRMPAEVILRSGINVADAILRQTEGSELLLLGASDDPLSGNPLPDGPAMDIAQKRKFATLVVKSKEERSRFVIRGMLGQITRRVTALTAKERSELLGQLKVGLQARTDFYLMVALAASIAITGLIMNDGSIVLGAMLVSPLMSPIVGIACGIALGNVDLIRRSGGSTFKGMAVVLGMGMFMTFVLPNVEPTEQILSRTHPGIFDLLAALAAGAAGAYSLGRKSVAGALPGVAMSLSLEPPLATAGYGLSTSQFWITGGAFLLFLTNLAAIVLSGVGVYLLLGMRPPKKQALYIVGKSIIAVILVTLILVVPLGFATYGAMQKGRLKFQVESEFRTEALRERFELLDLKITEEENGYLIHPTVMSSEEITPEKIEKFRKVIEQKVSIPIQIEATILQTKRIESPPYSREKNHD